MTPDYQDKNNRIDDGCHSPTPMGTCCGRCEVWDTTPDNRGCGNPSCLCHTAPPTDHIPDVGKLVPPPQVTGGMEGWEEEVRRLLGYFGNNMIAREEADDKEDYANAVLLAARHADELVSVVKSALTHDRARLMDELEWIKEGTGDFATKRPPTNLELFEKVNEIVEWINSKKDQLL